MRFNTVLPAAALAASATAKTVKVDVGEDGLSFSPEVITAAKGDVLEFTFYPPKHSVVLGDVNKPCEPATEGLFFSGFMTSSSGAAKSTFQVMVNSTDPMYIYCSFDEHCQGGMSAVINGDQAGLSKYKASAAKASQSVSPKEVTGGQVVSGSGGGESTTSSSESATKTKGGSTMSTTTGGGSMTTTTTGSGSSSSAAGSSSAPSSTVKPGAAAGLTASVVGVLAAAGGVAAFML